VRTSPCLRAGAWRETLMRRPKSLYMKRILLVDDDPTITRIYQVGLSRRGFHVESAPDGLEAIKAIRANIPDAVVLDLMMPRLSGIEVLRLIRQEPKWASLPVVVLSNAYVDQATREAATLGAQKGLLKMGCTPALLEKVLHEVLGGKPSKTDNSRLLVALEEAMPERPTTTPIPVETAPQGTQETSPEPASAPLPAPDPDNLERARAEFLDNAERTCADLRGLFEAVQRAPNDQAREMRLHDLYRKVHFVTAGAGIAGCRQVGQMAAAFEALLFGMLNRPGRVDPSLEHTAELIVDFFKVLFQQAGSIAAAAEVGAGATALVVDDDRLSARLAVAALRTANLHSRSVSGATDALELLERHHYDLILLDVEMPNMDGFELCRRIRQLPDYKHVPVIFVTLHSGFDSLIRSMGSGGDDLIAKPYAPMELAAKAVMHLLKREQVSSVRNAPSSPRPRAGLIANQSVLQ
jgi:CheY-like chemotaxis protein